MFPYLHKSTPTLRETTAEQTALAAELRRDIEILATDIGPRGTFAPRSYRLAEDFLASAMKRAGFEVERQSWTELGVPCANLIAVLPGTTKPDRILVIGAHYDSVEGCPAANDNGSGVAGLLAIARRLAGNPRRSTIRFVFFANEEPPFFNINAMGSQIHARSCFEAKEDIRGMIALETIGYYSSAPGSQKWPHAALSLLLPSVGNFIAMIGPSASKPLIAQSAKLFEARAAFPLLAAAAPDAIEQIHWSDHRGYIEAGYQAFMVTDTAPLRYPHYHQPTDTADKLDYASMARVVEGLTAMTAALADSI